MAVRSLRRRALLYSVLVTTAMVSAKVFVRVGALASERTRSSSAVTRCAASDSLKKAAEELVRASLVQSEASSLGELTRIRKILEPISEIASQNKGISDALKMMTSAASKQTEVIQRQTRISSYHWALSNLDKFVFFPSAIVTQVDFVTQDRVGQSQTKKLVADVLRTFLQERGHFIHEHVVNDQQSINLARTAEEKALAIENCRKQFHAAFIKLVHQMTGIEPTIILTTEGRYAIFQGD